MPALCNGPDYCCKVVVGEHHIGDILGDIGTRYAHADAYIGLLYGGSIVHAVARHCGYFVSLLPSADYSGLVLGLDSGIDCDFRQKLLELLVAHLLKFHALDCQIVLTQHLKFAGYGHGRKLVVARYHYGRDAGSAGCFYRILNLGTHRVYHAAESQETELFLEISGLAALGLALPDSLSRGQHS